MSRAMPPKTPKIISLFSGAGGLDIGFHDAGFEVLQAVELEKNYSDIMKLNSGDGLYFGDKLEVLNLDVNEYSPPLDCEIDWIIGGPPCQTFSAAGRRANGVLGLTDPRGILFERYVEIVKAVRPKGFLYENVYGLVGAEGGEPWRLIKQGFEEAGYKIFHRILDAADYGAPQHRERLIMVGLRNGEFKFPRPTHGPDSLDNAPHFCAGEALAGQPNQTWDGKEFGGQWGHLLPDIPPGLNYSFYCAKLGHPNPIFAWRSKFSDFLYKADPEKPVRTIKAQGGKYTGPLHWANRHFTDTELKMLQSFPENFLLGDSERTNRAVIGNSVPPALARALAHAVKVQVFDFPNELEQTWMEESTILTFRQEKRKRTKYYAEKAKNAHLNGSFVHSFVPVKDKILRMDLENEINAKFHPKGNWVANISEDENTLKIEISQINEKTDTSGHLKSSRPNNQITRRIRITPINEWDIAVDQILVSISPSLDPSDSPQLPDESLPVTFNFIREVVKRRFGIDDLIQLNGYYQQGIGKLSIEIDPLESNNDSIWSAVEEVIKSENLGRITKLSEWSKSFGTNDDDGFEILKKLKRLGYDIRDNSTNQNISRGSILVTYAFPTLNTSKVQWDKKLGGVA